VVDVVGRVFCCTRIEVWRSAVGEATWRRAGAAAGSRAEAGEVDRGQKLGRWIAGKSGIMGRS